MFESFKSQKTLVKELRVWLIEYHLKILGETERQMIEELVDSKTDDELATDAMSASLTMRAELQTEQLLSGKTQSPLDIFFYSRGNKLAHALAKAKGWELECSGSQALGYTCYIK